MGIEIAVTVLVLVAVFYALLEYRKIKKQEEKNNDDD